MCLPDEQEDNGISPNSDDSISFGDIVNQLNKDIDDLNSQLDQHEDPEFITE